MLLLIMVNTKLIFVTGGVVSSLGKGIIAASIGKLLQARGYKITIQKFDPYINVDSGTLNPDEHGECYVTIDGYEADLDLGHYERFTDIETTKWNSFTSGRIYRDVIEKERCGDYLGKTVQVVPHITDEIKRNMQIFVEQDDFDFVIIEIGGTVGDIEGLPFIEAMRQLKWELGKRVMSLHLTLVPYISAAGELKTKPTQHSVKELQSLGVQPDMLILRTEYELDKKLCHKVARFCNVHPDCVIECLDVPSIYEVPIKMQSQGVDRVILKFFDMEIGETPGLVSWRAFIERRNNAHRVINIGLIGKYSLRDAYKSIIEALMQSGVYNDCNVEVHFIDSEKITDINVTNILSDMDGCIICPGFGQRGVEGKIIAARYCRENNVVTLGICFGMQIMVIEFARNVLGLIDADSSEISPFTSNPVVNIMERQKSVTELGGTMRLGGYVCLLKDGSKAREIYGREMIVERHRHRYEFNNAYIKDFETAGMMCTGINPDNELVEIVEAPNHDWYIGVQYHPEYSSTVLNPNPLIMSFLYNVSKRKK